MKRELVLSVALLLPAVAAAQANVAYTPGMLGTAEAAAVAATANAEPAAANLGFPQPRAQTKAAAAKDKTNTEVKRPKSEGSMVGYVEDATIGSKIRIRFDAGFDNPVPDRAEFFYAKCGCYKQLLPPSSPAFDPKAPGPGPGIPNNLNFQQLYLTGEFALNRRFSVFADVPFRFIQPQGFLAGAPFANFRGISDVRAGVKLGVVESDSTSVTFQFKSYFPSGDASKGLGTNHYSIEPALLLYHGLSPRWALEAQVGDWHPIDGSRGVPITSSHGFAGDVFFYGFGPSVEVYRGNRLRFGPVVELVGWHVLGGLETVAGAPQDATGTNIVNMKFGGRFTIDNRTSIYIGYGRALTDADWYRDIFRVEYRFVF
jgi:hypothetical protein